MVAKCEKNILHVLDSFHLWKFIRYILRELLNVISTVNILGECSVAGNLQKEI